MTLCVVPEGLAAASAAVEALTASAGLMAVADGGSGVAIHRGLGSALPAASVR
jgi:hypothetical protein